MTTTDKEVAVLAIPEICVDKIIALYHTSMFAGHQGVVKTYLAMKEKFFIPCVTHWEIQVLLRLSGELVSFRKLR